MSPHDRLFPPLLKSGGSCALRPGKSGIGWARLMPLVKWCWHAEGLLEEDVIHHDFRMSQKQHSALGVMVWDP